MGNIFHFLIVALSCFVICAAPAWCSTADSLQKVAGETAGKTRYDALKALSKFYKPIDPVKSIEYASEERKQARSMKDRGLEADAMNDMAIPMLMTQQNRQAVLLLQESQRIYDSLKDENGIARVTANLGIAWSQIGSFENSLSCYNKSLEWYMSVNDTHNQARILMSMGLVCQQLKKYDEAIRMQEKALTIFTSEQNERMIADVSVNLGSVYREMRDFTESENHLRSALTYYQSKGITYGEAVVSSNLARLNKDKGDLANAVIWYTKAIPLIRKIQNTWAEASVYYDLADIHFMQGNWQEALADLTTAASMNDPGNDPLLHSQICQLFSNVYDTLGHKDIALVYYKRYTALRDTIQTKEKTRMIEELSLRYEISRNAAEYQLLKARLKTNSLRLWMLAALTLAILLTMLIIVRYFLQKRKQLLLNKQQAEKESLETRDALTKMSQEMTAKVLQLASNTDKKGEMAEKLVQLIPYVKPEGTSILQNLVDEIIRDTDSRLWEEFILYFEKIHPAFMATLARKFPDLTNNDRKICALIRMNLSNKEISHVTNRSVRTVESTRYQVKKKLGLAEDQSLTSFIMSL